MAGVDFGYFLNRKYSILQQEANATTRNAASTAQNADATTRNAATSALTGAASAGLDQVRAQLLPGESAAQIGNLNATAANTRENTRFIAPLATASIGESTANSRNTNAEAVLNENLGRPLTAPGSRLGGIFGGQRPPGFSTSNIVPLRARPLRPQDFDSRGNLTAAGLDYTNGYD